MEHSTGYLLQGNQYYLEHNTLWGNLKGDSSSNGLTLLLEHVSDSFYQSYHH